jgi:hypothetical protein
VEDEATLQHEIEQLRERAAAGSEPAMRSLRVLLVRLAGAKRRTGDIGEAERLIDEAMGLAERLGDRGERAGCQIARAELAKGRGDYDLALQLLDEVQAVLDARQKLIQGYSLYQALSDSGIFPSLMTKMVKVGEDSGALPDMLADVTEYYEEEVSSSVQGFTSMIEPALIIALGGVVLVVILGIYLPIFNLSRAAAKGSAKS